MPDPFDWKSEEGRRLLRAAYPSGVLEEPGSRTIGGWAVIQNAPNALWWATTNMAPVEARVNFGGGLPLWQVTAPMTRELFDRGDFLPDPTDLATWTLMKHELLQQTEFWSVVERVGWDPSPGMGWCRFGPDSQWFGFVVLLDSEDGSMVIQAVTPYYDFDTDDPRVALVLARAAMREVADG